MSVHYRVYNGCIIYENATTVILSENIDCDTINSGSSTSNAYHSTSNTYSEFKNLRVNNSLDYKGTDILASLDSINTSLDNCVKNNATQSLSNQFTFSNSNNNITCNNLTIGNTTTITQTTGSGNTDDNILATKYYVDNHSGSGGDISATQLTLGNSKTVSATTASSSSTQIDDEKLATKYYVDTNEVGKKYDNGEIVSGEVFNDYENNIASGGYAHSEGLRSHATGYTAHSEGLRSQATGSHSHSEGFWTVASGAQSHAQGFITEASGENSFAGGSNTKADQENQFVVGKFNTENNTNSLFVVGYGTEDNRKDALVVKDSGNVVFEKPTKYEYLSANPLIKSISFACYSGNFQLSYTGVDDRRHEIHVITPMTIYGTFNHNIDDIIRVSCSFTFNFSEEPYPAQSNNNRRITLDGLNIPALRINYVKPLGAGDCSQTAFNLVDRLPYIISLENDMNLYAFYYVKNNIKREDFTIYPITWHFNFTNLALQFNKFY